jgi:hypothetical protein
MSAKSAPDTAPPPDGFGEGVQIPSKRTRAIDLPLPPPDGIIPAFHTVNFTTENGVRVVKIRVVPEGDELIVDAATGRLLESRPSRPTAPPPMGKFAAPLFEPMT